MSEKYFGSLLLIQQHSKRVFVALNTLKHPFLETIFLVVMSFCWWFRSRSEAEEFVNVFLEHKLCFHSFTVRFDRA
jgi:hypothetical protein